MKQIIRKGLRDIIVDEIPEPIVKPHHVLIRPIYSIISSGTETASIHQEAVIKEVAENPSHLRTVWEVMKATNPVRTIAEVKAKFGEYAALGYSGAGILIDKHSTVLDLNVGDRVAYGGEGTGHAEVVITGRNLVVPVPDSVPFEHASFATLGSIAMNAVRKAEIGLGETVAVIGLGIIGQIICQLVRANGGNPIAIDLIEHRVDIARELGAGFGIHDRASINDAVMSITNGRGADCVIVAAASKSSAPCLQAVTICRDGGRIVIVGAVDIHFPYGEMYKREIRLYMSRAYGPGSYDEAYEAKGIDYPYPYVRWTENRNMSEFLRQVERGAVNLQRLITHEFPLEEASRAYESILDPKTKSLAVLVRYPSASHPKAEIVYERRVSTPVSPASSDQDVIRLALIGASNIVRWAHMPYISKSRDITLRAVYSSSGVRGKSYARRYHAEYCCTDYETVLSDAEIDAVLITSRHQYHAAQALAALRAGKHVFIEKPMALTEDECLQLYEAVRESGKQLCVGFNRRFAPVYREQKKKIKRRVGPAVINCRVNSPGMRMPFWAADPSLGGAILGEAVHYIDLMYWLLESEPIGVSAFSLPVGAREPLGENNIVASFTFKDGSIANLTYCTIGSRASQGEALEVFYNGGSVAAEGFKTIVDKGFFTRKRSSFWPRKGYNDQMESFVKALLSGTTPEATVIDGIRATLGALRMIESARTQTPCSIDLASIID